MVPQWVFTCHFEATLDFSRSVCSKWQVKHLGIPYILLLLIHKSFNLTLQELNYFLFDIRDISLGGLLYIYRLSTHTLSFHRKFFDPPSLF